MNRNNSNRISFYLAALLKLVFISVTAQESQIIREGEVSYLSGKNVYVKFRSTEGIENGDTLFIKQYELLVPALVVQNHSSISCLCIPLNDFQFQVSDTIYVRMVQPNTALLSEPQNEELPEKDVSEQVLTTAEKESNKSTTQQVISGRISLSSYSNFSDPGSDDLHRFRYTLSLKAANVMDSKTSLESYISFMHKLNHRDVVKENFNNALKIYNLALKYDFNETTSLWAGRKINPNIANVGAIDGFQFEKHWDGFFAGVAAGTRPDYMDYGYNVHLPEYGGYAGHSVKTKNGYLQSTLAFFEQRNHSKTDRRFIYFQHSNSTIKSMNVFSSFELDLYKLENGKPKNALTLISLYFSARYSFSKRLSMFGSYDNRKNVIYYETFRNYSEEILQQASRQGLRFRVNYRPVNKLILGIHAGTRIRKEESRSTTTFNGLATYTSVPTIDASLTASANLLQTAYLDGQIFGGRLSKDIIKGKLSSTIQYRHVDFKYVGLSSALSQNIGELDFSCYISKKWYFSVNLEFTFQEEYNQNRLYFNLRHKL